MSLNRLIHLHLHQSYQCEDVLLHIVLQRDTKDQDIYFVCVPGFSTSDEISPIQQAKYRVECVRTQFPEQFGEKDVYTPEIADHPNASTFYLLTWYDFLKSLESQSSVFQVDTLVQVAPLIHMVPEHLNVLEIQTRIVMGDLMNPDNSMNLTKSMEKDTVEGQRLRSLYAQQEEKLYKNSTKNISIPTLYARQIPIPYALMESLPDTLRTPLLDKAFEQFVGRVDPALPWAESISVANHATIMKMLTKLLGFAFLSLITFESSVDEQLDNITRIEIRSTIFFNMSNKILTIDQAMMHGF